VPSALESFKIALKILPTYLADFSPKPSNVFLAPSAWLDSNTFSRSCKIRNSPNVPQKPKNLRVPLMEKKQVMKY
jgi:hypothetical protein